MKPNLDIQVEPSESGKAGYLPLAPTEDGGSRTLKLVLRLRLQNKESSTVKVTDIATPFPRPAAVSWGSNRIDVFVRGLDDHLGHLWIG